MIFKLIIFAGASIWLIYGASLSWRTFATILAIWLVLYPILSIYGKLRP